MTEKRFTKWNAKIRDNGEEMTQAEVRDMLNNLNDELSEKNIKIDYLQNENNHLKQRNTNQTKQLNRLYNLIEKKDWKTLTDIIDDFKQCEEQLQKEWRCYCE